MGARAYKLDEAAERIEWAETKVQLALTSLTGPLAPHYFRITQRRYLGISDAAGDAAAEARALVEVAHGRRGSVAHEDPDDAVLVVKDRMASLSVSQILLMTPAAELPALRQGPLQPSGCHERRHATQADRQQAVGRAEACYQAQGISERARNYLVYWARGSRRRVPRPRSYEFLSWRHDRAPVAPRKLRPRFPARPPRPVQVRAIGGDALPIEPEPDDDRDPGPLVVAF